MSLLVGGRPRLVKLLTPGGRRAALERDVTVGLTAMPKRLPAKWHYDAEGSRLFGEITGLPEYYLTRRERSILERHAAAIADRSGADTLVELGSGTSEKTQLLLDAMAAAERLRRIVLVDVDAHAGCERRAAFGPVRGGGGGGGRG